MRPVQRLIGVLVILVTCSSVVGDTPSDRLATMLARRASVFLSASPLTVEGMDLAALLVEEACRLAPDRVDLWRMRRDVAVISEEDERFGTDVVDRANAEIIRLDPLDDVARLARITRALERYQLVEDRIAAYERLLDEDTRDDLGPAVASRLAADLARLHYRTGNVDGYGQWLGEAMLLDPSNVDAASTAVGFFRMNADDPVGEAELLTMLILADPTDAVTQAALARHYLEHGAYVAASRFYGMAADNLAVQLTPADHDLIADQAIAEWARGRSTVALTVIRDRVRMLNQMYQYQLVQEDPQIDRLELAQTQAPVPPMLATVRAALLAPRGNDEAAAAFESARAAWQTLIDDATNAETPDPDRLAELHLQRAWVEAWLGGDVDRVQADLASAESHRPLLDTARKRFEGWLALRNGESDLAIEILETIEDDMPARLGLALAYREAGRARDAARAFLGVTRDQPGTLMGVWSADRLAELLGQRMPISDVATRMEDLARSVPRDLDRYPEDPSLALKVHVRAEQRTIDPYHPVIVLVDIANHTPRPIEISQHGPVSNHILLNIELSSPGVTGGLRYREVVDIGHRLRIEGGETLRVPVDLRLLQMGDVLLGRPIQGWTVRVTALLNFAMREMPGGQPPTFVPGVLGSEDKSVPFHVDGARINFEWLGQALVDLASADVAYRQRTAAMLSHAILLGPQGEDLTGVRRRLDEAGRSILAQWASADPVTQAWLIGAVADVEVLDPIESMSQKSVDRVVQLVYLVNYIEDDLDPMLDAARRGDDEVVRRAGGLVRKLLEQERMAPPPPTMQRNEPASP